MKGSVWIPAVVLLFTASSADALPRFAARTGADCLLCHVSPSGGGARNRYGSSVYQQLSLALENSGSGAFSGQLNEWLSLGADLRAAYLFASPERSPIPGGRADNMNSFFLMQADLYTTARLGAHVTVALDAGVYSGFEAWAMVAAAAEPTRFNLLLRAGRFMPAFGLRDANHDLFTRQRAGFGASDRDTGIELTGIAGRTTLSVALVNGTFGDEAFDTFGSEERSFEKALVSRLAFRLRAGWLSTQIGASFYLNDNSDSANPLFREILSAEQNAAAAAGVDELRAGGFLLANLGRFTYSGELVVVRDSFAGDERFTGYAAHQELAVLLMQGLDLLATFEFLDADVKRSDTMTARAGVAMEFFPWPMIELRLMARHSWSDTSRVGRVDDVVFFMHAFF